MEEDNQAERRKSKRGDPPSKGNPRDDTQKTGLPSEAPRNGEPQAEGARDSDPSPGLNRFENSVTYRKNPKVIGWFDGQVMKATKGQANPAVVNQVLKSRLDG